MVASVSLLYTLENPGDASVSTTASLWTEPDVPPRPLPHMAPGVPTVFEPDEPTDLGWTIEVPVQGGSLQGARVAPRATRNLSPARICCTGWLPSLRR